MDDYYTCRDEGRELEGCYEGFLCVDVLLAPGVELAILVCVEGHQGPACSEEQVYCDDHITHICHVV
jgi:hypothetical protein